jgi:nucleotide-binding universal stress UspA family protein
MAGAGLLVAHAAAGLQFPEDAVAIIYRPARSTCPSSPGARWGLSGRASRMSGGNGMAEAMALGTKTTSQTPRPFAERRLRRSYESGHRPRLLVIVDEAPDCEKAVYYAARRAARIGGTIALLRVIEPSYGEIGWLAVTDLMRAEAQQLLTKHAERVREITGVSPETLVCEGSAAQQLLNVIQQDEDIAILVLAAGSTEIGPGVLVSDLARTAGTYPIPVVIVPSHLSDEELDALS